MSHIIEYSQKPKKVGVWDVAIIGSGPSSLTAAIYTTRGAASTLILGGESWGGQLMLTTTVDNFPGFPDGVEGPDLMKLMRKQAERFGAEFVEKSVVQISIEKSPFEISTENELYKAKSVILATGADTKWLNVAGEEKFRGRGVSSCAPCDAPFFKDHDVAVVGGGDSAMEEALVLTKYANQVTIIHRRDEFRASLAMQKKVLDHKKIKVLWNSEIKEFMGDQKLSGVKIHDNKSDKTYEMQIDGVFVAIGHIPATQIFRGHIDLDELGYIKRYEKDGFRTLTSKSGVFVAGDVHDNHYRQAITAAGFGCMAAMDTLHYLDKPTPNW